MGVLDIFILGGTDGLLVPHLPIQHGYLTHVDIQTAIVWATTQVCFRIVRCVDIHNINYLTLIRHVIMIHYTTTILYKIRVSRRYHTAI